MILLGEKIKELRQQHKYTQSVLAEKVGVTLSSIASYENNSRQPSYEVLIKLADVFKVSTDVFLLENRDKTNKYVSVEGLSTKQIDMIEDIIKDLRTCNITQKLIDQEIPELNEVIKKCISLNDVTETSLDKDKLNKILRKN